MKHEARASKQQLAAEIRKQAISGLLVRKPNITQRQIVALLAANEMVNPENGKPYSLTTINKDIQDIKADWLRATRKDAGAWIGEELGKLAALEETAWQERDHNLILAVMDRRAKYLGLHNPQGEGGEKLIVAVVKASIDVL